LDIGVVAEDGRDVARSARANGFPPRLRSHIP